MSEFAKILVTIGVIILWFLLSVINTEMRKVSGHSTPGIFGMILLLGVIGAVRAIWKSKKNDNEKDEDGNDSSILQK